ncbi:glycosyltransferase family 25 protein [Dothistroma septosporum NZE10]|uniref:Glycosyltransferase family 25 protein n=1 Tax=Dothistroma septosporum (strain NZE10 / CBS 128990) TaxID=675120 RepID=N1PDY1_DOTSN|nr:glycosyltransferase family 25 protein [Dothistroma septosporum NZE10]
MLSHSLPVRVSLAVGAGLALLLLYLLSHTNHLPSSHFTPRKDTLDADALEHVFNSTLGFQKIFVINLPSRTDHRDTLSLAATLTGLEVEYVDGATEFDEGLLPPGGDPAKIGKGSIGAWRAHMNVARRIVEQNITSALVLEGDVDWDIRIKTQMHDFARASRQLLAPDGLDHDLLISDFRSDIAANSPYGDTELWDLLWIGHCGSRFAGGKNEKVPVGKVVIPNDQSVPEPQHLDFEYGEKDLLKDYPPHTRVVSRARMNVCTLAYGMSQAGARPMCDGLFGRPTHSCISVQPQLFQHHRPVGPKSKFSGISDHGDGFNEHAYTRNIRWSTRINFDKLVYGQTDYIDSYQDGQEEPERQ